MVTFFWGIFIKKLGCLGYFLKYYWAYPQHYDERIRQFKKRHNFARRKAHKKRRPTASDETIEEFLTSIEQIFNTTPKSHIFNADETFWRLCENGDYTWAAVGSTKVNVNTCDEKAGFTSVCMISADGQKYPPVLISVGTTERCEKGWFGGGRHIFGSKYAKETLPNPLSQIKLIRTNKTDKIEPQSLTDHSLSGWTTLPTWLRYLYTLRYTWCPPNKDQDINSIKNRIVLICDSYPVHFSKEAKEFADLLNILLVQIPEGLTDTFQPLDYRIFGVMKNQSRSYLNMKIVAEITELFDVETENFTTTIDPVEPTSKKDAVAMLEMAWKRITDDLVLEAWGMALQQYINEEEDVDDYETVDIIQEQRNEIMQMHKEKLNEFVEIYLERQNTRKEKKRKANQQMTQPLNMFQGGGFMQQQQMMQPPIMFQGGGFMQQQQMMQPPTMFQGGGFIQEQYI
ncbi:hypothetical protein M9Y10_021231 [Tritrichomonas musculus]|uniref:DDE-1 domain-containing protein n=1 Tax=Tritrichomonas musculus TaxID=1915356 RepID=A0ABR2HDD8_9EUKA